MVNIMKQSAFALAVLMLATCAVGCSQDGAAAPQEIAAKLAKAHQWRNVTLQEPVGGVYKGTATVDGGGDNPLNLNIEVRISGRNIETKWTSVDGSSSGVASMTDPAP